MKYLLINTEDFSKQIKTKIKKYNTVIQYINELLNCNISKINKIQNGGNYSEYKRIYKNIIVIFSFYNN